MAKAESASIKKAKMSMKCNQNKKEINQG